MSKEIAIKVEDVAKLYRLGQVGTGTLSHDLKRWWASARGKEDPFMKVGVENERTNKVAADYAWALQDINFDIRQGDTLGIIGRNGAGKSTLLKLLSRVTAPSKGQIKIKGRIASLLEVGTGFHPELTGKENVYMNGAILGMTKKEIDSKFDEIVDFAGVELYINTPVKRYSSGMYVRLAFGVAAHLEPEILIVDEVLAVGDAEFQKKCLGKMEDVAGHGRTIIFVSHNMQAVQSLCKTALYLKAGKMVEIGETSKVINNYLNREIKSRLSQNWDASDAPGNGIARLISAKIDIGGKEHIFVSTEISIHFEFVLEEDYEINLSLFLNNTMGTCIFNVGSNLTTLAKGVHRASIVIPPNLLNDDTYTVRLMFVKGGTTPMFVVDDILAFEVTDGIRQTAWYGKWEGMIRPTFIKFVME